MGTLRLRLAIWHACVLSVILAVFAGLIYGVVRDQLIRHHDSHLIETAQAVSKILSQEPDCETLTDDQRRQLDRLGPLVLLHEVGGQRRMFFKSSDRRNMGAALESRHQARQEDDRSFETLGTEAEPMRVFSQPYKARNGRAGIIQVAQDLGDVPLPLASLRWALLLMSPLAVALAGLGGYGLARNALSPVAEVTRLAREIEAGSLNRRLPIPRTQDEIGGLVTTLNQMIARLEAAFEAMRRFTADASHELRGPLTTMRGAVDVTLSQPRQADEYRQALLSVGQDVDRLQAITADLLVLARADAGRSPLENAPVRLDVVAREVVETLGGPAEGRRIALHVVAPEAVTVSGDERWLRQLVFNLVHNALKFVGDEAARPAAEVVVRVNSEPGDAVLSVSDNGPGIPEDKIPHIFERFYRADSARTRGDHGGAGLGLSIAAWIVSAHGGEIRVQNRVEGGCLFTIRLRLAESTHGPERA